MEVFLNLVWALVWWFIGLVIHLGIVSTMLISFTWTLLVFARILHIPWVDGTTTGFLSRK